MAGVWEQAQGRLRWVVVPPLRSIDASIEEINFAKQHGAVGLFFRGIERDRTLDDSYFFPVYQEAARLNMPICVHTGAGCPAFTAIFDVTHSHTFPHTRTLPLMAFRNIVANKIPERFPALRFGFIEAGASWVPYVLHALRSVFGGSAEQWGPRLFQEYRLYTAYEEWEDLPTWYDTWGTTTWSWALTGAITAAADVAETRQGSQTSSPTCAPGRMCPAP